MKLLVLLLLFPLLGFTQEKYFKTLASVDAIELPSNTKVLRWDKSYTKIVAIVHTKNTKAKLCKGRYEIECKKKGMVDVIDMPNLKKSTYINGKLLIDKVELVVLTNKQTLIF
jgi:hypothetical protein